MIIINTPLKEEDILKLKVGDEVFINGEIFSARDKAHEFLLANQFEEIMDSIIYHCGPIIKNNEVIAAGPTTSSRMNLYTPSLIKKYGIKAIIGKGGMDDSVKEAIKGKAVYLSAIGGAACLYAEKMKMLNVYKKEFGMPEAIYKFEVKEFPVIVTIDARGNSIYDQVLEKSKAIFLNKIN
jgi:tartrate/fumarate subfamily iron-sulfur-dependent hydro-lyase beta chain